MVNNRPCSSCLPPYCFYAIIIFIQDPRAMYSFAYGRSNHSRNLCCYLYRFPAKKTHLDADTRVVIIFKLFAYCSNFNLEYAYAQPDGLVKYCSKRTRNENHACP